MSKTVTQFPKKTGTVPLISIAYEGLSTAISTAYGDEIIVVAKSAEALERAVTRLSSTILYLDPNHFKDVVVIGAKNFVEVDKQ